MLTHARIRRKYHPWEPKCPIYQSDERNIIPSGCRYRDPQPQVVENYPYLFNLKSNIYKCWCLNSHFIPIIGDLIKKKFNHLRLWLNTAIHNLKWLKVIHICLIWDQTFTNVDVISFPISEIYICK